MNTSKELIYRLYTQKEERFTRTNIQSEFARYNDIKYGNIVQVKENVSIIRDNYYEGKGVLSDNLLRNNIYHFVVSCGIIARVCVDGGLPHDESYTLSDIYIRRADKCTSPEAVIDLLCEMQVDYATRMHDLQKNQACSIHVRNAITYIYNHLHESLTVARLAENEQLDPSYFSRLFTQEIGTTAKAYIMQTKIATAKNMLRNSEHSLSDISFSLGFSSQSAFTSAFKSNVGVTPGEYRRKCVALFEQNEYH